MADEQEEYQKTEDPSEQRLKKAREEGNVPLSRELTPWLNLLTATLVFAFLTPVIAHRLKEALSPFLDLANQVPMQPVPLGHFLAKALMNVAAAVMIPFILLFFITLAQKILENGIVFSPKPLTPSLSKISLMKGAKRFFSLNQYVTFAINLLKFVVVTSLSLWIVFPATEKLRILPSMYVGAVMDVFRWLSIKLLATILSVYLFVVIVDFFYQRFAHRKKLRMTKQEVKEEYKTTEGDPQVKARLRQIRTERAKKRIAETVPKSDVVITNPTHFAIALAYDPSTMLAPIMMCKGQDELALQIKKLAHLHGVTIVENPPLARALYATLEEQEAIPEEHYRAVAEIISYVFKQKGKVF